MLVRLDEKTWVESKEVIAVQGDKMVADKTWLHLRGDNPLLILRGVTPNEVVYLLQTPATTPPVKSYDGVDAVPPTSY